MGAGGRGQAGERRGRCAEADASPLALTALLLPKRLEDGERAVTGAAAAARFPTTASLAMALDGTLGPTHSLAQAKNEAARDRAIRKLGPAGKLPADEPLDFGVVVAHIRFLFGERRRG